MFNVNFIFLAGLSYLGSANCILSAGNSNGIPEKTDSVKKTDNVVAQSINRDYIAGYDEGYGHGGYGLTAHASYGFPEGHGDYGVIEGHKHHIHHTEDHHHHHHDHHDHHKHYDYAHHKALAIKSLLVPLAGVALLGAAAAFVSNPILLQLGVISGSSLGRKKRSATTTRLNDIKLLEKFISQIPEEDIQTEEQKMVASYLSCSGATGAGNQCLERLACELHSAEGTSMPMEGNVMTIVLNDIIGNGFVPEERKVRLMRAVDRGKRNFGCGMYKCEQFEERKE